MLMGWATASLAIAISWLIKKANLANQPTLRRLMFASS